MYYDMSVPRYPTNLSITACYDIMRL